MEERIWSDKLDKEKGKILKKVESKRKKG